MSEWQLIRKQLLKNMLYNLIAFTIVFSIFGVIIFSTVKTFLYQSSTEELLNARQRYDKIQISENIQKPGGGIPLQDKIVKEPRIIITRAGK